jgi:hypothetical protein
VAAYVPQLSEFLAKVQPATLFVARLTKKFGKLGDFAFGARAKIKFGGSVAGRIDERNTVSIYEAHLSVSAN